MLNIINNNCLGLWIDYWNNLTRKDPFCHPSFIELFCNAKSIPICVYWENEGGQVLIPLIKRNISYDLGLDSELGLFDLTSPYGYGGPYFKGRPMWDKFWASFIEWARSEDVVSCFIRFSLLIPETVTKYVPAKKKNKNIIRDLDITHEKLWYDYEHKVRKNVKRAINNNIEIKTDDQGITLNQFIDIYYETMKRRKANAEYYFRREFFERIISQLKESYLIFNAYYKDEIISTELVLFSSENIYSFLGGTREKYFLLRPNDLLKHKIISWGINNKKKNYILGGGYSGEDGIYLYKKSFAPNGVFEFKVGEIIVDEKKYNKLIELRKEKEAKKGVNWVPNKAYFPAYRS